MKQLELCQNHLVRWGSVYKSLSNTPCRHAYASSPKHKNKINHRNSIHKSPKLEKTQMSTNNWIDTYIVMYSYKGTPYTNQNE
jgi:hypothetical protein